MEDNNRKVSRPWRIVAAEAAKETDPDRMLELLRELNQAVDDQELAFRKLINRKPS